MRLGLNKDYYRRRKLGAKKKEQQFWSRSVSYKTTFTTIPKTGHAYRNQTKKQKIKEPTINKLH